jgi:hypothetical protein
MVMCNACGIYYKNHGFHRPMDLVRAGARREQQQASPLMPATSASGGGASGLEGPDGAGTGGQGDSATSPPHRRSVSCSGQRSLEHLRGNCGAAPTFCVPPS